MMELKTRRMQALVGGVTSSRKVSSHILTIGQRPVKVQFGGLPLKRQDKAILNDRPPPPRVHYTELERRVRAGVCEACGSTEHPEVHHVRKLKDIRGRGGRGVPAWRRHMAAIQRKTLILCSACHHKLHAGQFDDNFGRRS